jgi:hypothetical protein
MAKKRTDVVIENKNDRICLYSDLTKDDLESVEGVIAIADLTGTSGYISFNVDPRYDENEVIEEIRKLAEEKTRNKEAE